MSVTPKPTVLDRFFTVAVIVKGIDGAIELLVGLLLLLVPGLPHVALESAANHALALQNPVGQFVSRYMESLDDSLAAGGSAFLVVFLIAHGVIKLALVGCLLKRWYRAYPAAIVVLLAFLGYQIYLSITAPTFAVIAFALLDALIVFLVYREYRELRVDPRARREPRRAAAAPTTPSAPFRKRCPEREVGFRQAEARRKERPR
jgi:uncharacterized membrane protein